MTPPGCPPPCPTRRPRPGGAWMAAAAVILLFCAGREPYLRGQEPATDPGQWQLTLPSSAPIPPVWTLPGLPPFPPPELHPPVREPDPAETDVRARLASLVKNGRLSTADSSERTVVFRPLRRGDPDMASTSLVASPPEPTKPPGPLEDAALAAAVRSRIAADPDLGKRGVSVNCQAGWVSLRVVGNPVPGVLSLENTAALVDLALTVEPVLAVRVELPEPQTS